MKIFHCPNCDHAVWFDNLDCEQCDTALFYDVAVDDFVIAADGCANRTTVEACNWPSRDDGWCSSCALDVDHQPTVQRSPFQTAKRRTLRQLRTCGVDVAVRTPSLRFDMRPSTDGDNVMTGHEDGLITLDTAEAEPAHREEIRTSLGEPYRTPLGHVRHELGHWWWATAIDDQPAIDDFRRLFGDERTSYAAALEKHYSVPDDGSWRDRFVSHYAASHPWEDFAESFAHVLHINGTHETAVSHKLLDAEPGVSFAGIYDRWIGFTLVLNALNRSMGTPDPYPFVISPPAATKIAFAAGSLGLT